MHDDNKNSVSFNSGAAEKGTRLSLLYEIGRILAVTETMREAAPQILETICRHLHFELGEFWIQGENAAVLRRESVWHSTVRSLEKFVADSRELEFAVGIDLSGRVWRQNAPVWIENLSRENKDMPRRILAERAGLHSAFAFPILLGEKFLGTLSFFGEKQRPHDEALLQMFVAVGGNIGQFIKRERVENNLRESEERYRAFIKQSTEGIWRFELDEKIPVSLPVEEQVERAFRVGYLAECNDAMAEMYGLEKAEELVGSRISDLFDMTDAKNIEYLRAFVESGYNLTDAESHEKAVNGDDKFFLNSLVGTVENGDLIRVWGTQRDITEQKRAEHRLRDSETNFRAFVKASSQAIWTTDTAGQHLEAFGWWENQTGQTREQSAGAGFLEAIHPDDRERMRNAWQTAITTVKSFKTECRIADRLGGYQYFALRGVPVFNADDGFRQWIGTLTDITDRKLAEQSLIDNEERYRALVEATATVVWRATADGELNFVGSVWETVSGQRVEEILGSGWLDALHPDDRENTVKVWQHALAAKTIYETEFRVLTIEGGYRWFGVRGVPILNGDGSVREWVGANTDIHERRLAEEKVRESEERYRSLFETMDEGFCLCEMIFDADDKPSDYRFLETNPVFERMTGLQNAAGKTAREMLPNLEAHWFETYGKVVLTGEPARFTDGSEVMNRWFDVYALRVGDENSRRFAVLFNDITERRIIERERERFLSVGADLQVICDVVEDRLKWVNPAWERVFGWTFEELTTNSWRDLVHPEDYAESVKAAENSYTGTDTLSFENRYRHKNGSYRWLSWRSKTYVEENLLYAVAADITERKRVEEALRESQEVLSLAMSSSRMGAWSRDLANETVYWSAALEGIFGLAAGTFAGNINGFYDYVYAEDKEYIAREVQSALDERRSYIIEFRFRHADGSLRWMEGRGQAFYAADGKPTKVYGIGIDITERKLAEAERELLLKSERQAREIAEQANQVKDEFIALVSHELRSPLNAMLGWTRILQKQKTDEQTISYALDVIARNALSQSRLIEDLLDIARLGKGKLRIELVSIELIPIINAAVEVIKPAAESKNINLTQNLDRAANFITGDGDRLRQVVENLLANAVKFTPDGGSVEILLERADEKAKIIVSDTGQGISAEFLPQIFERFKQADPSTTRRHGGLGIGLSLARDLVELHGGAISAESAGEGEGTTIIATLPLRMVNPIKKISDKVENMDSQGKLSGFWILAVDDEADAREIISFMLQINGARVTSANSAVEALEILKNADERIPDILLSDISMPNENGYSLLEKIRALPREHGGQIPAVALTAFNRPEDREAAFEAGFQKHLGKPVDMDALIDAIVETATAKQTSDSKF